MSLVGGLYLTIQEIQIDKNEHDLFQIFWLVFCDLEDELMHWLSKYYELEHTQQGI